MIKLRGKKDKLSLGLATWLLVSEHLYLSAAPSSLSLGRCCVFTSTSFLIQVTFIVILPLYYLNLLPLHEPSSLQSYPIQSGDRRYLYHQGNEQTTGGALRAAARPWFIPAGKYIPADRPQRSTPLQRGTPLQPVREVAAL